MRKLMWLTLGVGTACGMWVYILPETMMGAFAVGVFCFAVLAGFLSRRLAWFSGFAASFLGLALGLIWCRGYQDIYLKPLAALDGATMYLTLRTGDYSVQTQYGLSVDAETKIEGKTVQVRAYLDGAEAVFPATELEGSFRIQFTGPKGEEENPWLSGNSIFLIAYQTDEIIITENLPETLGERASVLRRQINGILTKCFPERTVSFAKALLLGDTSELSYETDTDLKISGIRHVAAVSGLHVSILFALLTRLTFRKRYLTALVGLPALLLFAALAGFTPSVNRACLMSGLMLLGLLADREYDGPTALSFASLVMLILNPLTITSVSFQLSVASVAGIFLFQPGINGWLKEKLGKKLPLTGWIASSVSTSLSATVLTSPLCAWYFGTVSLIGVVTNLLTLWVISVVFYGILAVVLLGTVWQAGGILLAKIVSLPIRYVLFTAGVLADFPLAAVYTQSGYILLWLIFVYALLFVFLLSKDRKPGLLACCGALGLCIALLAAWLEPTLDDTRITVLDVGQGQCILLQNEGKNFLVDCGGDSDSRTADIAAEMLLSQGIRRLDGLILTHLDRDHAGAAKNLLNRVDTSLLFLPETAADPLLTYGQNVVCVTHDLDIRWDGGTLRIFSADFPGTGNENSLCILFDTKKCDILITGDRTGFGERMLLRSGNVPDVDVLVAGHHGSAGSTCEELLRAILPETVCISVGADNPYGHPAQSLLQRLQDFGCSVYRTDLSGTILIRS